jgi:hypothetical protein
MRGLFVAPVAVLVALASPPVSGASASPTSRARGTTAAEATIALGGRTGIEGLWRRTLRLKFDRGGIPVSFTVCGVWGERPKLTATCRAAAGTRLPKGTRMRLEQHRTAGWKRVGQSPTPALTAVLSNDVSGNRYGTVFYRVTLRQRSGRVLRTSNPLKVVWHR